MSPDSENPEDYEYIDKDLQQKLQDYTAQVLVPQIINHLKRNNYGKLCGVPVQCLDFEELALYTGSLKGAFTQEQHYDLYKTLVLVMFPSVKFCKMMAQESVGAAIRICKVIGKEKYANKYNKFVKGHFIPDDHQKELGLLKRSSFE
jgi:hypothetical protein